ncbi:MAG: hypothetical protein Q9157_000051 [Trypethelium eluteriae]
MVEDRKEGKGTSKADKAPVPQARATPASATPEISTTPATSTVASHGQPTSTKPTKTGRLLKPPSNSMSSPDECDAAATSAPTQSSQIPGGTARQHGFIKGRVDGGRYPAIHGWRVREQDEPIPGQPPCIFRGTANVIATYKYTKDDEKNKLGDGFTLTPGYSKKLAEALCSMIDQNPQGSRDQELQLETADALACGHRRWHWHLDAPKVEPERVWAWARQQLGSSGIRLLLADYIECLTQVKMSDGKCDANCVKIYLAKYPPDDAARETAKTANTASASTEAIDSFVDFPTATPILIITLQLIGRSRSRSPFFRR